MEYQELFNKTLSKMRLSVGAALENPDPLMRSVVKIMYDFSDDLKANNLIRNDDNGNYKNK